MEDGWDGFATGLKEGLPTTIVDDHNSGCSLESFKAQELMNTSAEAAINHQAEEADEGMERKRRQSSEEVVRINDPKSHDQLIQKKPRFVWTTELHNRFLDAVTELGCKKAVPTKILRVMNVEGLTRENVASHLQKFRLQMKKRARDQLAGCAPPQDDSKTYCPFMSGISQQALVLPNTIMMQCRNIECACFSPQQLLPSFPSQNSNMFGVHPTVQEAYGMQFKDVLFDEGVGRTTGAEVVHGFCDGNAPYGLDELQFNFPLPPKPLVDPFSFNDNATLDAQYHRPGELSLADQLAQNTEGLGGGLMQCPPQATANHLDGMNDDLITRGQIFDVEEEFFSFDAGNESPVNWLQDLDYKGIDDLFQS